MSRRNQPRQGVTRVDAMMADDTMYLRLWGEPIAQPRPRARLGGHGRIIIYDPSTRFRMAAQVILEAALREIQENDRPVYPRGHDITVRVKFFTSDTRKDLDNLLKYILDVLQGPVLGDDRYVVELHANKCMEADAEKVRTDVEIEYF